MRLTQQTDVSLRLLLFLAVRPGEPISVQTICRHFEMSEEFAAKTAKQLVREGVLASKRGRSGGVMLARPPEETRLGALVRKLEPLAPLECVYGTSGCPIEPACALRVALRRATEAFVEVLDGYTLADLTHNRGELRQLLKLGLGPGPGAA